MISFKDLTVFDLNLIKSNAVHILINTKTNDRYVALANSVISCVKSKGFNIKDESKDLSSQLVVHVAPVWKERDKVLDAEGVIELMFEFLTPLTIKDETRIPTWSTPKSAWYTQYDNRKKPWQF